uniref:Sulfatase n=1 Tax=Roseihalotalea indica TaxID=2867963 RepID=A0AA49GIE6_9BACT|nr:sulfatase [Tunicatimonas sp. TK19036]
MITFCLSVILIIVISDRVHSQRTTANQKPNVLFIAIDDMNDWISLFDPGNPITTPHLENLAARGAFFTQAYCSSPACNPSRASIMTGTRPHKTGIYGNAADWRGALPEAKTLQQYFMDDGYYVGGAGKIFHHHADWTFHDDASFHEFLLMKINEPYPPTKLNKLEEYGSRNTDWGPWPEHIEETADYRTTSYAIDFLQREHTRTFFLNVGIYKPHSPFFAPADFFARYQLKTLTMPTLKENDWNDLPAGAETLLQDKKWFWRGMMAGVESYPDAYREFVQAYQSCATFADAMVGRVIDALDQSAYRENTIIVLWSDHGFHLGEKEHIEKFALWEKTTHVPYIIVAPGQIEPGTRIDHPVDLTTVYPTLAELCRLDRPEVDGLSLVPLLNDHNAEFPPALMTYGQGNHAIRSQQWRYIQYADGTAELYDHRQDPNEWNNLAGEPQYQDTIQFLKQYIPNRNAEPQPDLSF